MTFESAQISINKPQRVKEQNRAKAQNKNLPEMTAVQRLARPRSSTPIHIITIIIPTCVICTAPSPVSSFWQQ
jgi:hypothetical protein